MLNWANITGLEGLFNLNQQGIDVRPTLLRVITDQYLQTPVHTTDEERQFTELAMRLLDETEIATRAAVAKRLAPHGYAPRPIILQLARDVLEVAEPVLLQSPCLTPKDLREIAASRGASYAQVIARRLKADLLPHEAGMPQVEPTFEMPSTDALPHSVPPRARRLPPAQPMRDKSNMIGPSPASEANKASDPAGNTASELSDQFFMADAEDRRLIIIMLDYSSNEPANPPPAMQPADIWQMEAAALQRNLETVAINLEQALDISQQLVRRIIADERGEPIVIAARALAIPANVLQRMLLFMNPVVGQSVERVYKLAALHNEMTLAAAWRMIDIWQEAEPAGQGKAPHLAPSHLTQWQSTVRRARQALTETPHHTSVGKEPGTGKAPGAGKEPGTHRLRANGTDTR